MPGQNPIHRDSAFKDIFDQYPDGIYMVNSGYEVEYINAALEREFGPINGRKCFEYFRGRQSPCTWCQNDKVFAGKTVRWEWTDPKRGKTYDLFDLPVKNSDGSVSKFEIFHDITRQKEMEKLLRSSNAQFSNALTIAHLGPWEYDLIKDKFIFNDHFYAMFRTTAQAQGGYMMSPPDYARKFCHPDDMFLVAEETRKAVETADPGYNRQFEHRIYYADGEMGYITVRFFIVKDEQGRTIKTYGVNQDITARKKAEEELRCAYSQLKEAQDQLIQSAKMAAMGQLVAGVSHELNQPLTGIKGYAQTAYVELKELGVPETLRQDLNKIIEQADRMASIIENLRIFARKSEVKMEGIDINVPLQSSLQLLGEQFRVCDIRLEVDLGPGLPLVNADSNQLQQVFLNLLTNARDALEGTQRQDGRVSVQSRVSDDGTHIEALVSDNGCGISASKIDQIFNPFYTTKDPNRGMGLGLSIAYSIVHSHSGSIEVSSEEGKGSTFTVKLPVVS